MKQDHIKMIVLKCFIPFALSFLFMPVITFAQATSNHSEEVGNNWKSLDENGYSIQFPGDWELNKSGQMGMSFILLSRQTSPQDAFRENVNLLIQDLKGQNMDLGQFVEISIGQIKTMLTNGSVLESKTLNENGNEFHKIIYSGDHGVYKLKFVQHYFVRNEKAYVLTLSCELGEFDKYKETGEKIMESFTLE